MDQGFGARLPKVGWFLLGLAWLTVDPSPALACPDCVAGVRAQVRQGIFNDSFAANLAATLAPFGIFLGVAVAIHSVDGRRGGIDP